MLQSTCRGSGWYFQHPWAPSVTVGEISTQDRSEVQCSMYWPWHRAGGKGKDSPRGKARLRGCRPELFRGKEIEKDIFLASLYVDGFGLNKQTHLRIESVRLKNIIYGLHFYISNKNERCYASHFSYARHSNFTDKQGCAHVPFHERRGNIP